jgi:hypothetical protein
MTRGTWPLAAFLPKELRKTLEVLFGNHDIVEKSSNQRKKAFKHSDKKSGSQYKSLRAIARRTLSLTVFFAKNERLLPITLVIVEGWSIARA